jgi:hypothetical protein
MGYDLHITRAPEWSSRNRPQEITEAEWLAVVDADPKLRLATKEDACNFPGMVLWMAKVEGYAGPWFAWVDGYIYSKNPNGLIIEKMIELAQRLNARVLGEEDEQYLPDGSVLGWERTPFGEPDWRGR